jgi:chromosomal replication initiator protein
MSGEMSNEDLGQLWRKVLTAIQMDVSTGVFSTWFKNTKLVELTPDTATVRVFNVFHTGQFEQKFKPLIGAALDAAGFENRKVTFVASESEKKSKSAQAADYDSDAEKSPASGAPRYKDYQDQSIVLPKSKTGSKQNSGKHLDSVEVSTTLNEKYTFDTFIVGSSNDLAYAASQAIVNNPGKKYNPLFLYGGSGLGKTHLIQAIGNGIKFKKPKSNIVYISCEKFVNDYLDHVRNKKTGFANKYRNADVLIVDDIQFIAGKEKTQEEFFHTFNALHQADKQIVITSDKPPKSIPTLDERLSSRFEWGMAIDIQTPDYETRHAILQMKAEAAGYTFPEDAIEYLANLIQTNTRELEGALSRVIATCELRGLKPSLDLVQTVIGGSMSRPKHLSPKSVVEQTAKYFHIDMKDLIGPKRDKDIVEPRQIAMYLLRTELALSLPKIAAELGRKDHTTALHSIDKVTKGITFNGLVRQQVQEIKEKLYG